MRGSEKLPSNAGKSFYEQHVSYCAEFFSTFLEAREKARFLVVSSKEDMALSKAVDVERLRWRKFNKTRFKGNCKLTGQCEQ